MSTDSEVRAGEVSRGSIERQSAGANTRRNTPVTTPNIELPMRVTSSYIKLLTRLDRLVAFCSNVFVSVRHNSSSGYSNTTFGAEMFRTFLRMSVLWRNLKRVLMEQDSGFTDTRFIFWRTDDEVTEHKTEWRRNHFYLPAARRRTTTHSGSRARREEHISACDRELAA